MPRSSKQILEHADDLAARFENLDPDEGISRMTGLGQLYLAMQERAESERNLQAAVHTAREEGTTWDFIGRILGTTGEAARQRYGKVVKLKPSKTATAARMAKTAAFRPRDEKAAAKAKPLGATAAKRGPAKASKAAPTKRTPTRGAVDSAAATVDPDRGGVFRSANSSKRTAKSAKAAGRVAATGTTTKSTGSKSSAVKSTGSPRAQRRREP